MILTKFEYIIIVDNHLIMIAKDFSAKTSSHAYNNNKKIVLAKISSYAHNL